MSETTHPAGGERANADSRSEAVRRAARRWADQLIEIGARNRLLFYRNLKVGSLELTEASSSALEGLLQSRPVRLSKLFDAAHQDDARRRARAVAAKARENFEERGLSTLYLTRGMATWHQASNTSGEPAAPILLATVSIKATSTAEADFELQIVDDWEPNPTLLHYLKTNHQIDIDPDDLLERVEEVGTPDAASDRLVELARDVPGLKVTKRTVIGNFSYAKQPMVNDLENAVDVMIDNDLIAALSGDQQAVDSLRDGFLEPDPNLPDLVPAASEFLPMNADASQHRVINAALRGGNLVIQGPPGTGKSQTIANLIAALNAYGRSVLFVAEKRAAIDAVMGRLKKVGLDDLVLDLHGGGSSRTKMTDDLRNIFEQTSAVAPVERAIDEKRLEDRRARLNEHVQALHAPREPWGRSVYELQTDVVAVPEDLKVDIRISGPSLVALRYEVYQDAVETMSSWVSWGGPAVERGLSPWSSALSQITSPDEVRNVHQSTRTLHLETLPTATQRLDDIIASSGLRRPASVAEWAGLLDLMQQVVDVEVAAKPDIWFLDLASIRSDLAPANGNMVKRAFALMFNGRYRKAKKSVTEVLHEALRGSQLLEFVNHALSTRNEWELHRVDEGSPRTPYNLEETSGAYSQLTGELAALGAYVGTGGLSDVDTTDTQRTLRALLDDQDTLQKLPTLHDLDQKIHQAGFSAAKAIITERDLDPEQAAQVVTYVWATSVLDHISSDDPRLAGFNGQAHSKAVQEFIEADTQQIAAGAKKVRRKVAEHFHAVRQARPEKNAQLGQDLRRRRRRLTLRQLTENASELLLALKPCWAMSPLAVSQLLDAHQIFDVVIFDEASQVPPADAIPAIMRAKQAIVAGDSKQLPPTAFFASPANDDDLDTSDDNYAEDMESILDAMSNVVTTGAMTLRWHYRSRDERLIAFSNAQQSLYRRQLVTFPGVERIEAIRHEHVPWTASPGSDDESPSAEVARVVELVGEHAREHPHLSLGIIAMGVKHADRIEGMLRRAFDDDPILSEFCNPEREEPFFVKNLERVQGDERDAIILSIGYGKGADGKMKYRFGPINMVGGERRLNVAITRARSKMTVVSSFLPTELDQDRLRSEGAKMLGRYLAYAASRGTDLGSAATQSPAMNPFEQDIYERLTAAGLKLHPQLGVSGYFIDFAASHPDRPGEYVLAIEADGAAYHSSATARDRDRLRQEHLEGLGWRFHRIWSTAWFKRREDEIARAVNAWQEAIGLADLDHKAATRGQFAPPASTETPREVAAPGPERKVAKPFIRSQAPISDYSDTQLVDIVAWVNSDGLLRTDDELFEVVFAEMGLKRRGDRIKRRLYEAIGVLRRAEASQQNHSH